MAEKQETKKEDRKESEKAEEKKDAKTPEEKRSWFMKRVDATASRAQEILGSDGGTPENQEKKKEASKALGTITFGGKMLFFGILGALSLAAGTFFLSMKKFLDKEKAWTAGINFSLGKAGK